MLPLLRLLWLFVLFVPWTASAQSWLGSSTGQQQAEFLEARDVFRIEAIAGDDGETVLRGSIAPGYYLYRHRLSLVGENGDLPITLSKGIEKTDEFFGRTEVYYDELSIAVDRGQSATAVLHWQGCADAGICYPPQTMKVDLPFAARVAKANQTAVLKPASVQPASVVEAKKPLAETVANLPQAIPAAVDTVSATPLPAVDPVAPSKVEASASAAMGEDQRFASRLAGASLITSIAVFFGMGVLLAFTPCVLPMIPIVSSLIVGGQPTPRRAFALSVAYVLPMALTYAALGLASGLVGANMQALLQNPWLLGAFSAVFVVLALAMFGAFELQLPAWLNNRLERMGRGQRGGTLTGAAMLGFLSALLVGPCMTAPLAGALLYISQSGSALSGGLALFALGLGMGLPLLLVAVFGARILPRPGVWMDRVKAVFGYMLLALAISMLARVLPPATVLVMWGAWLLAVAMGFMALAASGDGSSLRRWSSRYIAAVSAIWALALVLGGASGASDPWRPLAGVGGGAGAVKETTVPHVSYVQAKSADDVARRIAEAGARGQWTLVDFYADWCVSCHVIEREVFADDRVAQILSGMQVLRPDVTANDAVDQELMRTWQVAGPPTLLLIGPDGQERRSERTVGEIDATAFMQRLQRVQAGGM
jgi:thiol:disulfide interchange protein DsbD